MSIEDRIKYFEEKREALRKMAFEFDQAKAHFNAEMKAEFGITEGEPADILALVKTIKKIAKDG
jgi:hypothetical protein